MLMEQKAPYEEIKIPVTSLWLLVRLMVLGEPQSDKFYNAIQIKLRILSSLAPIVVCVSIEVFHVELSHIFQY